MPSQTAHGYPYPLGTDRVMDGDDSIKALAEVCDKRAPLAGYVILPAVNAGTSMAGIAVTFPVGLFVKAPLVLCTASNSRVTTASQAPSPTGFTYSASNWSSGNSAAGVIGTWVAFTTD